MPSSGRETLRLGPPATGTIVVSVDAQRASSPFTAAVQTLFPGGELPVHRCRNWDEVWVVLKGQGRVTLGEGVSTMVVHGAVLSVPRQTWFGLRNTGNGPLQAVVVSAPAGADGFFRELAQLGQTPDPEAVQQIAGRYGVELRPAALTQAAQPERGGRYRRRRGGRGRGTSQSASAQTQTAPQPPLPPARAASVVQPVEGTGAAVQRPASQDGGRHRRRRRGGRGRGEGQKPGVTSPSALPPQGQKPQPSKPQPSGSGRSKKQDGYRRSRHVKEVYMGGKWVQVSGEGPVIASSDSGSKRHHQVDDDGPGGPLSVPL